MIDPRHARRLLFLRTDRLGETLLNLPAITALKQALPRASLTLLVHPSLQSLMARMPDIDHVMSYPFDLKASWWIRALRLGRQLNAQQFDIAVVSNPKKELHLAVWLAGIPCRVGYARKGGWLLTHRLQDRKALGEVHEVEYNLDLIRALGLPVSVTPFQIPRVVIEEADVLQLIEQQGVKPSEPFLVVHPWTSNPIKQWPIVRFAELIRHLAGRLAIRVVVIGGVDERDQASAVLPAGLPVVDLVGRLTLTQLAALLARARVLVSNDSGPVHLAAAVGTNTLVLFGASSPATGPRRWGPWGRGHVVIWKSSMEAIMVDEVVAALQDQLGFPR